MCVSVFETLFEANEGLRFDVKETDIQYYILLFLLHYVTMYVGHEWYGFIIPGIVDVLSLSNTYYMVGADAVMLISAGIQGGYSVEFIIDMLRVRVIHLYSQSQVSTYLVMARDRHMVLKSIAKK